MNKYRVLLPVLVDGEYGQGDEFEKEFTEHEENANIDSGLLEVVPREYKVIGGSNVHETDPGGTFTAALRIGQEAALVAGGHIERVNTEKAEKVEAEKKPRKKKGDEQ